MRRMRVPQRVDQLNLFHPVPRMPQWTLLPPEVRQKALSLLARLLRHHRRQLLGGGFEEEVRDE